MDQTDYNKRTIVKRQIASEFLGKERNLWVYLPPGYTELITYPVIYCQDGIEFLNYGRIATLTNYLVLEEDLIPPIIIGIEVDLPERTAEYSPTGTRYKAYSHFVVNEVIPLIERQFPVQTDVAARVLAGDSLGATVSLHLALDYPELFSKVLALSGAFLDPTLRRLETVDNLSDLDLYMLIGLQETAVKTDIGEFDFLEYNRKAKQLLELKQTKLTYREAPGRHIWGFWQNELQAALRHFLARDR
ncbi:MAG: esterase family protein [Gorillibacterium sp.]|nr:esterase family protein [Gorillibacterium sp.]